jgi:hypothetical protein
MDACKTASFSPVVYTLRLSSMSFKTYYLIHYFGCNLFILDVDLYSMYNLHYVPTTL